MNNTNSQPFSNFGTYLKTLRENKKESYSEVSGAVEIDVQKLQDYEQGKSRPTEDILHLIIQHFNLKSDDAKELWRLAGYSDFSDRGLFYDNDQAEDIKQATVFVAPQDARVVYTDMVQVMVNNYGVVINFLQGAGPNNQPLAISRVGMSKEHAKSVVELLSKTLEQSSNAEKPIRHLPSTTDKQE